MSSSSSSSSTEKYDVFLSFRGEDTRKDFTAHLFQALKDKSIKTYMDCLLDRGEDVWPALSKAIDNSQMSIIVFSDSYATSKWCLEELVRILQRRKDQGQVVIPVFYETQPSDIRNQRGTYGKAFNKYEGELGNNQSYRHRINNWRSALTEASNISGWDSRNYADDVQLIEKVVKDVSQKRNLRQSLELKGLVGREEICREVELHMKLARVIGIWGMPGIGKTTIAKVLFAKHFPQFDNVCFVANGKKYSLDKFLSELLKEDVTGITFDFSRLKHKKVFIVLDDVNNLDQLLEYLCSQFPNLSEDSRLIITTRDRQLLEERVDLIHCVKKWENPESLKLFCLEAFQKTQLPKVYEELTTAVVKYAGGVPLALKVLGSHLRSKKTPFWRSTLNKLEKYSHKEIQSKLKVSYDELDDLEKKIFLDIAFFFNGENKDHVISILDACGFEASSGVEVLEDRALITISYGNIIEMHDLLQKMAFDIVRQECTSDPARRSRLRDVEEVRALLTDNRGTDAIEGIIVDLSQIKDLHLSADTISKMKKLRFLKVYSPLGQSSGNVDLPEGLEPFSDELRYLEWHGYPLEYLPPNFCAKLLVEIRMPHSRLEKLWKGIQEVDNLEVIDLRESKQLKKLPDLSLAPALKWVNLSGCKRLCHLHPSILSSDTLVTLILDGCTNLLSVKSTKHLKSLKNISVNGCSSLKEFAVSSDSIENLDLSTTGIETLDESIGLLHNLRWLNLEGLGLKHLLKDLSSLTCLTQLKISNSGLVIDKDQLLALFDGLKSLETLYLMKCSNLLELPDNIGTLSKLYELRLDGSNLKRLPSSIRNLQELEILSLRNCQELLNIPELPPLIKELNAHNCVSLVSVSSPKTFAAKMMGKTKRISFENDLKLDDQSIMRSLHLTMVSAAFQNVLVRRYNDNVHSYNYNSMEVCLPAGSHVRMLKDFPYQTNKSSSITIQFPTSPNFLGLIYFVVLTPSHGIKSHGAKICCVCHMIEGRDTTLLGLEIGELRSDHVYMWYDPFHCDLIRVCKGTEACSFEFSVRIGEEEVVDGSIEIKECGVHLISVSELEIVLLELEMDLDKRKDLQDKFEFESSHYSKFDAASSSEDTHKEDDISGPWQIVNLDTPSSPEDHEPASHFPAISPSAEGSNHAAEEQAPNRSSKQEKGSKTSHVEADNSRESKHGDVAASPAMERVHDEKAHEDHKGGDHGGGHSGASMMMQQQPHLESAVPRAETSNILDQGPLIPPLVDPEVEKELKLLPLPADRVAVLGPFLIAHPTMRLITKPSMFCHSAYDCLWKFLVFVGSNPMSALLGDKQVEFTEFKDSLTNFSFDSAWFDDLMVRLTSPSIELERIQLRKQQISIEKVKLSLEMDSLEEQESRLRSLLDAPLIRL